MWRLVVKQNYNEMEFRAISLEELVDFISDHHELSYGSECEYSITRMETENGED